MSTGMKLVVALFGVLIAVNVAAGKRTFHELQHEGGTWAAIIGEIMRARESKI